MIRCARGQILPLGYLRYRSDSYQRGRRNTDGAQEAVNDFGRMGYGGPCPPPGHLHHYLFRLKALDVARLNIPPHAKCQGVQHAAERHKLAESTFMERMPFRGMSTGKHTWTIIRRPSLGRLETSQHAFR
jgi:hypothetical protein